MAFTLKTLRGNLQSVKVCIAASVADASLQVQFSEANSTCGVSSAHDLDLLPAELKQANAIVLYLVEPEASLSSAIHIWSDWEETDLRKLVAGANTAGIQQAAKKISAALGSNAYLCGHHVTAADIILFSALLPVQKEVACLHGYLQHLGQQPAFQKGLQQALGKELQQLSAADFAAQASAEVPRLPIPGARNILITSALPYVNNVPHLGNIIGCVLSADVYARHCRSRGYNSIYMCGTDEYGTATETKALEEGLTPQQICDKYNKIHADIYEWFDIRFDKFGRTPSWQQTEIAQGIFKTLEDQGQLVEQTIEQLYSEAAGKFLADRFVVGTCPKCKYEDARGDQCDSCGNLLNPTELISPRCKLTNTTPVLRSTSHIFLDLPKLSPQLQAYHDQASSHGAWSNNCVQVTRSWMRDGLKVRCITRDLKWGTAVPREGYEDKVFYVWFDAPIGYISITANYVADWQAWWQNPRDVELVQFMGKDNVPFHTVIFPATLLGTGQDWTLMKNISVTEYLNFEGTQFSKSRGVGVFGNDAKETGIPVEVWRYYLLANRPEQSDTDFKWSDLAAKNNSELLANLGNFINRGLSFVYSKFDGKVPSVSGQKGLEEVRAVGQQVGPMVQAYVACLEARKIKDGIRQAMAISSVGNKFFQDQKPWEVIKVDKEQCGNYLAACMGLVTLLAALVEPYMPSVTRKVQQQMNLSDAALHLSDDLIAQSYDLTSILAPGHAINKPEVLFRNITEEEVQQLRDRYKGSQSERATTSAAATTSSSTATAQAIASKQAKTEKPGKQAKQPHSKQQHQQLAAASTSASSSTTAAPEVSSTASQAAAPAAATSTSSSAGADGQPALSNGAGPSHKHSKAEAKAAKGKSDGGGKGKADDRPADISSNAWWDCHMRHDEEVQKCVYGLAVGPVNSVDFVISMSDDAGCRVDLRVGVIKKAWRHPEADTLYVEEVEVGEATPRQVVSGLVKHIPEEHMQLRPCVLVCNLKPANMRGVKSHAMVLAATSPDGLQVELVEPPEGSGPGDRVTVEGYDGEPDDQLNPKKKIFEQVTPDLAVSALRLACYKGIPLATKQGPCTVQTLIGGSIR